MLVWCLFNAAIDYICTPVLIVTSETMYWTLDFFVNKEEKFSLVLSVSFLGKPGHLTISKYYQILLKE